MKKSSENRKVIFHKKAAKYIQKIKNKELKTKLKEHINKVIQNPRNSKTLEHPFKKYQIKCHKFTYDGINYRIAFTVTPEEIVFLVMDSRENFYQKLRQVI